MSLKEFFTFVTFVKSRGGRDDKLVHPLHIPSIVNAADVSIKGREVINLHLVNVFLNVVALLVVMLGIADKDSHLLHVLLKSSTRLVSITPWLTMLLQSYQVYINLVFNGITMLGITTKLLHLYHA